MQVHPHSYGIPICTYVSGSNILSNFQIDINVSMKYKGKLHKSVASYYRYLTLGPDASILMRYLLQARGHRNILLSQSEKTLKCLEHAAGGLKKSGPKK